MHKYNRIITIILDGAGCGVQADHKKYHARVSNTLLDVYKKNPKLRLPHLEQLGLKYILFNDNSSNPYVAGKMEAKTTGNDTFFGIWEMMGITSDIRYRSIKRGFNKKLLKKLEKSIGTKLVGNEYIEGFYAMEKFFYQHKKTKGPIIYFAEDGIVLITAHLDIIPAHKLYEIGQKLADLLKKEKIIRIIVRPFYGKPGNFKRDNKDRRDILVNKHFFTSPILSSLNPDKIHMITNKHLHRLFGEHPHIKPLNTNHSENIELLNDIKKFISNKDRKPSLMFICLQEFDTYGHKKDVATYTQKLIEFDKKLGEFMQLSTPQDLIIITADHGCNPTDQFRYHTREAVPLLLYSKKLNKKIQLGTRHTFADLGQIIAYNFSLTPPITGQLPIKIFRS